MVPQPVLRERIRELLRLGAERVLELMPQWIDDLDRTTLSATNMETIAADPVLRQGARRSSQSNIVAWAAANVRAPGEPVPPNLDVDALNFSRDLVRRGLNEASLDSYRAGQNSAWRYWMTIAFTLTEDVDELQELLDVSAQSISAFLDVTIAAIAAQMASERDELTRGTHAERREVVALLVEGAPIPIERAEARLGYALAGVHTAAVVWSDDPDTQPQLLEQIADTLFETPASHGLKVVASAAALWLWLPTALTKTTPVLDSHLNDHPGTRVALGRPARGLHGFRRSHLDALTTQRMMARLHSPQQLATFTDVQLSNLVSQSRDEYDDFITVTLGELARESPALRDTVLTYIETGCNASRTAELLYTHRNTLLKKLERANNLLPNPLPHNIVRIGVALDALRWHGA